MPAKNETSTPTRATGASTPTNVTSLPQRTGSRLGTAASVVRIMPVEYSRAPTIAPSTATIRTAKLAPDRTVETGSVPRERGRAALVRAVTSTWPLAVSAEMRPKATSANRIPPMVSHVERRVRILIHSLLMTRGVVVRAAVIACVRTAGGVRVAALIRLPSFRSSRWCRGTPRRRGSVP